MQTNQDELVHLRLHGTMVVMLSHVDAEEYRKYTI